jgi:hypothetical protein
MQLVHPIMEETIFLGQSVNFSSGYTEQGPADEATERSFLHGFPGPRGKRVDKIAPGVIQIGETIDIACGTVRTMDLACSLEDCPVAVINGAESQWRIKV